MIYHKFRYFLLPLVLFPTLAFSWGAAGHMVVAEIAYRHLKPEARSQVEYFTKSLGFAYHTSTFSRAAAWADQLKGHDVTAFNPWHFEDNFFTTDNSVLPAKQKQNVSWAIEQSEKVLGSRRSIRLEKAMFLRFLSHFVGDAHQPLHCASQVSKQFPNGDDGANDYHISAGRYDELHSFWDAGAGLFATRVSIPDTADQIEKDFPLEKLSDRAKDLDPHHWVNESFELAKSVAYQIPQHTQPTKEYLSKAQATCEEQIALAGYRLANILNQLFA